MVKDLCQYLADVRETAGLSQMALANLSGLARSTVTNYENGKFSPTLETLRMLADGYGYNKQQRNRFMIDAVLARNKEGTNG